mgnify:CR=1 FL=1
MSARPAALLGAHAAPLGMRFYNGTMFPAQYRGAIFIARHGPWNRTQKYAADVVVVVGKGDRRVDLVGPSVDRRLDGVVARGSDHAPGVDPLDFHGCLRWMQPSCAAPAKAR